MKSWSIATAAYLLLANSQLINNVRAADGGDPPGFRSPQCTQGLTRIQNRMLQHFNGIFGSFSVETEENKDMKAPSIYGPIAAFNITSKGYGFNTNTDDANCNTPDRILRLGLLAINSYVKGDVHGSILTRNGTIDTKSQSKGCVARSLFHVINRAEDFSDSLFSFAPTTIRKTSKKLAEFDPDTLIDRKTFDFLSPNSDRSFNGYRILKFPACSDTDCVIAIPRKETTPGILKAGAKAQPDFTSVPTDEMIVFNIPVFVDKTFTLTSSNVNRNIPPCQIIYNFYPADIKGNYINDPNATFNLVRNPNVVIAGTILAPQANIKDSATGYFGGQLITLQNYEGRGASIKDFKTVSKGQCTSKSLCLPAKRVLRTTVQVITQTATQRKVKTVDEDGIVLSTPIASGGTNKIAIITSVLPAITKTVTASDK